jgi:hypothetical protein
MVLLDPTQWTTSNHLTLAEGWKQSNGLPIHAADIEGEALDGEPMVG